MKKIHLRIYPLILLICGTAIYSCNKNLLTVPPNNVLSDADFWKTPEDATEGVNAVYNGFQLFYTGVRWWQDVLSDEGFWIANGNRSDQTGWGGLVNAMETPIGFNSYNIRSWTSCWNMVALANTALDKIPEADFGSDTALENRLIAESKFMRAFAYHHMILWWGGVPVITLPDSKLATTVPARDTYGACDSLVYQDLADAIPHLPISYTGQDVGRVTKGAAMTLLMTQYMDDHLYAQAANEAKQIMQLNVYELLPDYSDIWKYGNKNTAESILEVQFGDANDADMPGDYNLWYPGGTEYGYNGPGGWSTPQQQLVNDYESVQYNGAGKIISSQTFDPSSIRYLFDTLQYKNRDPRLYASIWYNGANYFGQPYDPNWNSDGSGYNWRKYNSAPLASLRNGIPDYNYIVYRYAYVLLAYAESQNESVGPDASVYSAIDQVRERAGMPDIPAGLSQIAMRTAIQHEYRVELAGEGYSYECLIRWGIYQQVMAQTGINNGRQEGNVIVPDFRLLWPIPEQEIQANPNMKQNPGY